MRLKRKLWRAFEKLSSGAVIFEWARELGEELSSSRGFLRPSGTVANTYPCTARFPCECQHRLERHVRGGWVAMCECGCEAIRLSDEDTIVFEADIPKLARELMKMCGWEPDATITRNADAWHVGRLEKPHVPVFWCATLGEEQLRRAVDGIINANAAPFVLLTPTRTHISFGIDALLKREGCVAVVASELVTVGNDGVLALTGEPDYVRRELEARGIARREARDLLRTLHAKIDSVRDEHHELRAAKARLEEMQGENLFNFVQKIDAEAFRIVCAVLVHGDPAKASRALDMKDSTLRDVLRSWEKRGEAYRGLLQLVRWRKGKRMKGKVRFNDALLYEKGADAKRESVLSDLLDGLLSMTENNWQDVCNELAGMLRQSLPR